MVIDEADRYACFRADPAHRNAFVAILFQTAQGGFDQGFAAYLWSRTAKFRLTPLLFLHVIPFISFAANPFPSESLAKTS
jgi:hypothetical protein